MNSICPNVSIIVPVYKVEQYLNRCVQSIVDQSYKCWELLLIDDGSPDRSGELCDIWEKKDNRIKVFHGPNSGVSVARNIGLEEAKGNWVLFVDSDDWLKENCLEVCVKETDAESLDFFQFGTMRIDDRGNQRYDFRMVETKVCSPLEYMKKQGHSFKANISGCFIKKIIIDNNHIRFDDRVKHGEDQIFIISVMLNSQGIKATEEFYYYYYSNENSATRQYNFQEMFDSSDIYLDFINDIPQLRWKLGTDLLFIITVWFGQTINSCQLSCLKKIWDRYADKMSLDEVENVSLPARVFLSLRWMGFRSAWQMTNWLFMIFRKVKHSMKFNK